MKYIYKIPRCTWILHSLPKACYRYEFKHLLIKIFYINDVSSIVTLRQFSPVVNWRGDPRDIPGAWKCPRPKRFEILLLLKVINSKRLPLWTPYFLRWSRTIPSLRKMSDFNTGFERQSSQDSHNFPFPLKGYRSLSNSVLLAFLLLIIFYYELYVRLSTSNFG